ncbi:toll/interleukin-1 receptor domain-containing protein [Paenarthrobacter ilicis]|uniref:TIR domain-containing protein n=1 Tax=Paenarthrobacter ilicis TaxID=43665 RepID=UPI00300B9F64
MKVFLSWSGRETKSHAVAQALDAWLPSVINAVEPWVSSRGLAVGLQWNQQLDKELDDTQFGIIVVTPWNQHSQWLNFEAGALSKRVGGAESRVAPLLVDFPNMAQLTGPLSSYQAILPTKNGIRALVNSINDALGEEARDYQKLGNAFDVCWPALETALAEIKTKYASEEDPAAAPKPQPKSTDDGDMLSEILTAVRSLARSDARLSSDIRNRVVSPQGIASLPPIGTKRTSGASLRLKRISQEIREMGFSIEAVTTNSAGRVTITTKAPLTEDAMAAISEGLDWDFFGIRDLIFQDESDEPRVTAWEKPKKDASGKA